MASRFDPRRLLKRAEQMRALAEEVSDATTKENASAREGVRGAGQGGCNLQAPEEVIWICGAFRVLPGQVLNQSVVVVRDLEHDCLGGQILAVLGKHAHFMGGLSNGRCQIDWALAELTSPDELF